MKTLYITLFIFLFILPTTTTVFGQCIEKGISTNPQNPINNEKPEKQNTFDWQSTIFDVNSNYVGGSQIHSPFYQTGNLPLQHFVLTPDERKHENGWELIAYDFGFDEQGNPVTTPTTYVYLVLYNKYTGIMRVFVAGEKPGVLLNSALIQLSFSKPGTEFYTSALSNASNIFALDKFENDSQGPTAAATSTYLASGSKWFFADFHMAYDPCTCFYESLINIRVQLIQEAEIEISGVTNATITSTDNGADTEVDDGFSFDLKGLVEAGKKAQKSYKSIKAFTDEQADALKLNDTDGDDEKAQENKEDKKNTLESFKTLLSKSKILKAGLKAAPYVAGALEIVDFFVGGGKETSGPNEVKILPMSMQGDIELSGTINLSVNELDVSFFTPGAKNNEIRNPEKLYPYYNEVMGVFNLLETPKLIQVRLPGFLFSSSYITAGYKVSLDHVKYTVNPAANINWAESEIYAGVSFKDGDALISTPVLPIDKLENLFFKNHNPNITDIKLRILLNLKRAEAGPNTQNILMQLAYPMTNDLSESAYIPPFVGYTALGDEPGVTYTRNQKLSYFSGTWDKVILGGDISVIDYSNIPGISHHTHTAYGGFEIEAGTTLPENLELIQDFPVLTERAMSPATPAEINLFCTSDEYKDARIPFAKTIDGSEEVEEEESFSQLLNAYPNPFNKSTTIPYQIVEEGQSVRVTVMDMLGREVAVLVEEDHHEAGRFETVFTTNDLPSGIYLYTLTVNGERTSKRLVLTE